jgi:prepilin-type N-terminal cleavage/methylation domain-containing protein
MKTLTTRKSGFTLVEIMIVVAIIGLLAAIAIPNFVKARDKAQKNACIANLKQIDSATEQWALEAKKKTDDATVTAEITAYLKNNTLPTEPAGGGYTVADKVGGAPNCTLSTAATLGHTI